MHFVMLTATSLLVFSMSANFFIDINLAILLFKMTKHQLDERDEVARSRVNHPWLAGERSKGHTKQRAHHRPLKLNAFFSTNLNVSSAGRFLKL